MTRRSKDGGFSLSGGTHISTSCAPAFGVDPKGRAHHVFSLCFGVTHYLIVRRSGAEASTQNHTEKYMITAIQNHTAQAVVRDLTIVGTYPSGEAYSNTVQAGSSFEAMIRVLADRRYADDGGDLVISRVLDARTGLPVDGVMLSAEHDLLPETEAIDQVIEKVTSLLPALSFGAFGGKHAFSSFDALRAYAEYFGLVLSEAPFALEGLSHGAGVSSDEDMTLEFEDSQGVVHEFEPALALLALAEAVLERGMCAAALQVKTLAMVARSSLNLAALDALGDY
ncbi:hypothetical protein Bcep1808_6820 (plasmid) [Burkholderia vietnamiensis G4]|uniref:Uncharacterized protein n=1 Tax=Burkholderia vietnamiensis (strain G4 / LMG 22486) TaxID=269482 RepID=A4JTV4_BURVG|nr:hypothetical protein Bcep1808_6820 [Burkholderia vietnamiensis G4]